MKNFSKTKKFASAAITLALVLSPATSLAAYETTEVQFNNQYELFGTQLDPTNAEATSKFKLNADKIGLNNSDAVTFYSVEQDPDNVENGIGVMKKIGKRGNYETFGFDVDFTEAIKAQQLKNWQTENNIIRIEKVEVTEGEGDEVTTSSVDKGVKLDENENEVYVDIPEFDGVIKSGKWAFEIRSAVTDVGMDYFTFQNGSGDVMTFRAESRNNNSGLYGPGATNLKDGGIPAANIIGDTGAKGFLGDTLRTWKMVFDFDNNTFNMYGRDQDTYKWVKYFCYSTKYVEGTTQTTDTEKDVDLSNYGIDIKTNGISKLIHQKRFHGDPAWEKIDYFRLSEITTDAETSAETLTTVYEADFNDLSKNFFDYVTASNGKWGVAYVHNNTLWFRNDSNLQNEYYTLDYDLGKTVDSGVWAVDFTLYDMDKKGNGYTHSGLSGNWNANRNMVAAMLDNTVKLGIGHTFGQWLHTLGAYTVNDVNCASSNFEKTFLNGTFQYPEGKTADVAIQNGSKYRFIFDLDSDVLYAYGECRVSDGKMLCVNPEGYKLEDNFSMNKIRLGNVFHSSKPDSFLCGFKDFRVTQIKKEASAEDYTEITSYRNDLSCDPVEEYVYVSTNDKIKTDASFYIPADSKAISVITAVYNKDGRLLDVKCDTKNIDEGFGTVSGEYKINIDVPEDMTSDDEFIKVFVLDDNGLKPYADGLAYFPDK